MAVGIFFFLVVTGAGYGVVRMLGLPMGLARLGLAPAAGLALLAVLATWSALLALPTFVGGSLLALVSLGGGALAVRDRAPIWGAAPRTREGRWAGLLLGCALVLPAVLLGTAFAGIEVPLASHDGAFHLEVIHALRNGARWEGWYPPGYHATVAAFLQLVPWLDSAQGAFETSLGLTPLAPLAILALSWSIWRSALVASAGALVLALTYQYPYSLHLWSGWPMAVGMLLVVSLWAAATQYLEEPGMRWAILGALLSAAIVLTHGTEVYTALVGLVAIALAHRRRIPWKALPRDLGASLGVALLLAGPYLPALLGWAQSGGAVTAGYLALDKPAEVMRSDLPGEVQRFWLVSVGAGSVLLTPFRAALLAVGIWWAFRVRTGRVLLPLWLVFSAVPLVFLYLEPPAVQALFTLTFPWGLKDRLDQVGAVLTSLLLGAGLVALGRWLPGLRQRWPRLLGPEHPTAWRRTVIAAAITAFLAVEGAAVTVHKTLAYGAQAATTFSPEDAEAMAWLRQHARPGEVLANDWAADAGIWAPYKAGISVLAPRSLFGEPFGPRELIVAHVGRLESEPEAAAAACSLRIRYVFRGGRGTAYEARHFPSLAELQRSTALEQVFASGEAAVFRIRLPCWD